MKNPAITLKSGKLFVFPMPIKPSTCFPNDCKADECPCLDEQNAWKEAVQQAIESANIQMRDEDEETIKYNLLTKSEWHTFNNGTDFIFAEGKAYRLPDEIELEVYEKKICKICKENWPCRAMGGGSLARCPAEKFQLARIKEPKQTKEKSFAEHLETAPFIISTANEMFGNKKGVELEGFKKLARIKTENKKVSPLDNAISLFKQNCTIAIYEELQQERKKRLEFFKEKGAIPLIECEQKLIEKGESILSELKSLYKKVEPKQEEQLNRISIGEIFEVGGCQYLIHLPSTPSSEVNEYGHKVFTLGKIKEQSVEPKENLKKI
jgi:hypothetical protein